MNIGTQASHRVWGDGNRGVSLADLVHSGFVNGIRYDHLTFPLLDPPCVVVWGLRGPELQTWPPGTSHWNKLAAMESSRTHTGVLAFIRCCEERCRWLCKNGFLRKELPNLWEWTPTEFGAAEERWAKQGIKESPYPRLEPRPQPWTPEEGVGCRLAGLILKAWLGQGRAKGAKASGRFWDLRSGALLPPWWASAVWKYRKETGWLMQKHLRGEGVWCRGPLPRRLCYKASYTAATLSGEERREVGDPHVWCPSSFRDL